MNWFTVVSGVLVLVGAVMLVTASAVFSRRRMVFRSWATAVGVIVALRKEESIDLGADVRSTVYYPKIKFKTDTGREIVFQSDTGSQPPVGQISDTVAVRYNRDNPYQAEINSFISLWGDMLVLAVLGSALLFVGLAIIFGVIPL